MHDAHEAYMGDVTNPMAALLDLTAPLQRLKERLQRAIYHSLQRDLVTDKTKRFAPYIGQEIKDADNWALVYESYHLMHGKGRNLNTPFLYALEEQEMYRNFIVWTPGQAVEHFLGHYDRLIKQINKGE